MTILILGGTGRVGSATIDTLLESGETVRCLSHSPDKMERLPEAVERAPADLDAPSSLDRAFEGVSSVLLSLAVNPNEEARGMAAISAAIAAGVKKIVHISVVHTPGSDTKLFYQAKLAIEAMLKDSPLTSTIIRSANFYQSDDMLKPYIVDAGIYPPPIGEVGVDRIDARDVGHAAANALRSSEFDGVDVELYGPERYTGPSVAEFYAKKIGKPVEYLGNDISKWADLNSPRLGAWYISALRGLYEQQQVYGMRRPDGIPMHPLLPAHLRTFDDYVSERIEAWSK